ncbi:MAG: hypothetical protein ACREEW_14420 [Caulobacteraceae bacterium]
MIFTLNAADAARNALAAHAAGKLTAQSTNPVCIYEDSNTGCHCAIGVSFPPELHTNIQSRGWGASRIVSLIAYSCLQTDNIDALTEIQSAHDAWCSHPHNKRLEERFLTVCKELAE